jgi:hypothetical protein
MGGQLSKLASSCPGVGYVCVFVFILQCSSPMDPCVKVAFEASLQATETPQGFSKHSRESALVLQDPAPTRLGLSRPHRRARYLYQQLKL